ncbi:hypothetical protein AGMMS50256_39200 [Betaproteobacteria bacterium]|nr:hypothetical protein AGMMS50256_39200 [Betaproteobacteria bacterium]
MAVIADAALPDGAAENKLSLQVHDGANGINAGAGLTVTWTITSPDPATGLTLANQGISTTNADGVAEMSVTDSSGLAREVILRATLEGSGGTSQEQSATAHFTAIAYALPHPAAVIADAALPDGVAENRLSVQVYDLSHNANAGAGVSVTWTIVSPSPATGLTLGNGGTSTTDASGVAGITLTDSEGQPRAVTLRARVGAGGTGREQSATVNFAVPAPPPVYTLEASTDTLTQHAATSVTFTVKQDGTPVSAGTAVSFTANSGFQNLPSGKSTDSSGRITVANLTATASGTQTVSATVGGQTVSVDFTVTAASYTLEASTPNLTQHVATGVTFTVKRNNVALASTPVIFDVNPDFTNLPTGASTGGNGEITVSNLTATASGPLTVSATVDGQTVSVSFAVTAASYTLEASPPNLTQHVATSVTFTVKRKRVLSNI